ncbi:MAG: SLC45 family MFS transporter [Ruminococcaceae bacterium]|nr:SLC45 family MFS transporter [Oscillospiraceae bacterium]
MKLNYKRTIYVGFAFFLICAFWQAYDSIIPKILTDKFGLSQSASGLIMGIDNILALFLLPLFGAISDRCHFRRGRRTPFILCGTIIAVVLLITLGIADLLQLKQLTPVELDNPTAAQTLYDADLTIMTPDGDKVVIQDEFSQDEFTAIEMGTKEYTDYVTPARQAYARLITDQNPVPLVIFIVILLFILFAMGTFRSPAVALMPDVTLKPLRSKANAVINLMGTLGGILVLVLGIAFGTGKVKNALMSYIPFFLIVAAIMVIALLLFIHKVKEPEWALEMEQQSQQLLLEEEEPKGKGKKLEKGQRRSLMLLLLSVMLWFMGYNAVTTKYSVYAGSILNLDYNTTLLIAQGAAIVSYIPVGFLSSKIGRKRCIQIGIIFLGAAFLVASFLRAGSPLALMSALFALAGIGWAMINVNSFPMVVELATGSDVGRYTGYYYTASMAAQTATPYLSGLLMDKMGMTTLFPYGTVFVFLAFLTMYAVKHGDNKPAKPQTMLETFNTED